MYDAFGRLLKSIGVVDRYVKAMGHRQYGLKVEDLIMETPDVQDALMRLPKEVLSDRDDRIKLAHVLNSARKILPEDKWLKPEEDKAYLAPYIEMVVNERFMRQTYRD